MPGCTIDAGSSLTLGMAVAGHPLSPKTRASFFRGGNTYQSAAERPALALARDRAGAAGRTSNRPLAGPHRSRRPCAIAHVTSDVPGGSNFVFSRPQVVQPGRDCLANNSRNCPLPPTSRSMR